MAYPSHTWLHIETVHHLHLTRLVTLHIHEPIQLMFDDWEKIQSKSMDAWINGLMYCNGRKNSHTHHQALGPLPPTWQSSILGAHGNGSHDDLAPLRPNRRRRRQVKAAVEQARHGCHELLGRLSSKFNTTTKGTWLEIALEHLAAAEMTKTVKNTNLDVRYSGTYSVYDGGNGQGKRIGND